MKTILLLNLSHQLINSSISSSSTTIMSSCLFESHFMEKRKTIYFCALGYIFIEFRFISNQLLMCIIWVNLWKSYFLLIYETLVNIIFLEWARKFTVSSLTSIWCAIMLKKLSLKIRLLCTFQKYMLIRRANKGLVYTETNPSGSVCTMRYAPLLKWVKIDSNHIIFTNNKFYQDSLILWELQFCWIFFVRHIVSFLSFFSHTQNKINLTIMKSYHNNKLTAWRPHNSTKLYIAGKQSSQQFPFRDIVFFSKKKKVVNLYFRRKNFKITICGVMDKSSDYSNNLLSE